MFFEKGFAMNLQVQGRHLDITETLREHIELLGRRLGRQFPAVRHTHVTLTREHSHCRVDIRIWAEGLELQSEEQGSELYTTLARAMGKLERRLQKASDRHYRFGNHHGQYASLRCPNQRPPARLRPET